MRLAAIAVLALVISAACGSKSEKEPDIQVPSTAATPADPMAAMTAFTEPVPFTEAELRGLINAASQLRALGMETEAEQSSIAALGTALSTNREAMAILAGNGFTLERFQRVLFSTGLALAASEAKKTDLDKAQSDNEKALEKMKDSLSPEQYEALKSQMAGASKMLESMQEQPEGNVELVEKHRAELDAAFGGK